VEDGGTVKVEVDIERGLLDLAEDARAERARPEIADEVAWYNRHVEEHGLFADEWRTF
jgi:post-segregation antitoxin (ccd killing protein)